MQPFFICAKILQAAVKVAGVAILCMFCIEYHNNMTSIAAVLSHQMANGTDRHVAFASRTLARTKKNYAQIEREGLTVVFGVTK